MERDWPQGLDSGGVPDARRRQLLGGMAAGGMLSVLGTVLPVATATGAQNANNRTNGGTAMFAYVGCRTTRERNARGDGITVFRMDESRGTLEQIQLVKDLVNPSFLTINSKGDRLYTVHGDLSDVSAFAIDRASGELTFINKQSTQGKNPVHLALDPSEKYLVVSNHIGASLAVLPIASDGSIKELTQLVTLEGPIGPHRVEQKQAKPHFNPFDPSGDFINVPDKGLDRIFSFRFKDGKLTPANPPFVTTRETAGPRHTAFHPTAGMVYCVNELDSTVTAYRYATGKGEMTPLQIVSSLPETYTGNNRAAEIEVDRKGRYLYASNRGDDSIAVFKIDPQNGLLERVQVQSTGGRTPRFFALTPNGQSLFALNEESDNIVAFSVDAKSGRLEPTGFSVASGSPTCMVFSRA